ncbi:MAG: hypothetical protein K2J72_04445 [Oscillospiraceae bacterium]|nr:hypothetical protein [Oscillospiraceae bacterium]
MKIIKVAEILFIIITLIIGSLSEALYTFIFEKNQNANVKYDLIDFNNDGISEFLIISGNGTVTEKPTCSYNNVEIIYVCRGIATVEPKAFANLQSLKFLIIPNEVYFEDIELPILTDLFFIEDNEYKEFVNQYI